jgi:hypothetical protein
MGPAGRTEVTVDAGLIRLKGDFLFVDPERGLADLTSWVAAFVALADGTRAPGNADHARYRCCARTLVEGKGRCVACGLHSRGEGDGDGGWPVDGKRQSYLGWSRDQTHGPLNVPVGELDAGQVG